MDHLLAMVVREGREYSRSVIQPKRCAVCESQEIKACPLDLPDQLGKWKLLLADKVVYRCSNGHCFLVLPDESCRSEILL